MLGPDRLADLNRGMERPRGRRVGMDRDRMFGGDLPHLQGNQVLPLRGADRGRAGSSAPLERHRVMRRVHHQHIRLRHFLRHLAHLRNHFLWGAVVMMLAVIHIVKRVAAAIAAVIGRVHHAGRINPAGDIGRAFYNFRAIFTGDTKIQTNRLNMSYMQIPVWLRRKTSLNPTAKFALFHIFGYYQGDKIIL